MAHLSHILVPIGGLKTIVVASNSQNWKNRYNTTISSAFKTMKVVLLVAILLASTPFTTPVLVAEAAPNLEINYQGKLTDETGATVTDGGYDMEFSLYTVPSAGSPIWTETLNGANQVTVTGGLFSIMLGSTTALTGVDFNQTLYLGVTIGTDDEMTPRKVLGTVPAAFVAEDANDSALLGGVASTSFLRSDQADTASGLLTFTGGLISNSSSTITSLSSTNATTTNLYVNSAVTFANITSGVLVTDANGDVTASSSLGDASISDTLTIGSGSTFANDIITPNSIHTSGQGDELCLTYESTGTTWEWQDCSTGIGADTLDWDDFTDSMTLDATTTIAMAHALNFDSGTLFIDGQNDRVGVGTSTDMLARLTVQSTGTDDILNLFETGGTEVFTVLENGDIGIGNSAPAVGLDIYNGSAVAPATSGTASNAAFRIGQAGSAIVADFGSISGKGVYLQSTVSSNLASNQRLFLNPNGGSITIGTTSSAVAAKLNIQSESTNDIMNLFETGGQEVFTVLENGNVGIGTTAPSDTLSIAAGTGGSDTVLLVGQGGNGNLKVRHIEGKSSVDDTAGILLLNHYNAGNVIMVAGTTQGNVGIGTTSPSSKLTVGGGAYVGGNFTATGTVTFAALTGGVLTADANGLLSTTSIGAASIDPDSLDFTEFADALTLDATTTVAMGNYPLNFDSGLLYVDGQNNRIGIGTANPTGALELYGSGLFMNMNRSADSTAGRIRFQTAGVDNYEVGLVGNRDYFTIADGSLNELLTISTLGDIGIGTTSPSARLAVKTSGLTDILNLFETGGEEVFTVLENGNVGIGTTSPASKLDVWGDFRVGTSSTPTLFTDVSENRVGIGSSTIDSTFAVQLNSNNTGAEIFQVWNAFDNPLFTLNDYGSSQWNGTNMYFANTNGVVRGEIGLSTGRFEAGDGSASTPGYTFYSDNSVGMYRPGSQTLAFSTNSTEQMRITSAGDVGIGTTSPASKLDVWGDFRVGTSSTPTLFADPGNGRVGIGTDAPAYDGLHIAGDNSELFVGDGSTTATDDFFKFTGGPGASEPVLHINKVGRYNRLLLTAANGEHDAIFSVGDGSDNGMWTWGFDDSDNDNFKIAESDTLGSNDRLVIQTGGNVGIGDSSPAYLFTVGASDAFGVNTSGMIATQSVATTSLMAGGTLTDGYVLAASSTASGGMAWYATSSAYLGLGSGSSHDAVTLAGSYDYLTLSGQEITLGQIDLTTDVTGTLQVGNGGTGATTFNTGELLVGNGTSAITSTTTAGLKNTLALDLVENTALSTWTGSTAITTLGSISSGTWGGDTITVANGGTGATSLTGLLLGNGTSAFTATTSLAAAYINDGAGSGLDADLLDNISSGSFLRSDATDSYTSGTLTFDAGTTLDLNTTGLSIADTDVAFDGANTNFTFTGDWSVNTSDLFVQNSSGYVGIGTTSPASKLDVWGDFRVGTSSTPALSVDAANDLVLIGTNTAFTGANGLTVGSNVYAGTGFWTADDQGLFWGDFTTGVYGSSAGTSDYLILKVNGSERVTVKDSGNVGIGTTTPESILAIENTGLTGSVNGGIKQDIGFSNSTLDAVQYGDRSYLTIGSTATSTVVGGIIRVEDSTGLGNVVRGFEVQANKGTNAFGENTALSGFARTFGVRGYSSAEAGGTYEPAAGFFELGGSGAQGNAIRAYSAAITTSELLSLYQEDTAFSGTGLLMNFGNDTGGSFNATTSKFIDLQNAGTSKFTVEAHGTTTIGDGTTNYMASLHIGYGGLCVDNDGSCTATTTGRISSVSSYTGNSDLAEMYFSREDLEPGEIVVADGFINVTRATGENGQVLGVVSTKPGLVLGSDDTPLSPGDAYPLALSGRVPVKLSTENGPINVGDPLTLSSLPGIAMKATEADEIVGYALEAFDGRLAYTEGYINQFGDDIAEPDYSAINVNTEANATDGCHFGGGGEAGEDATADCDPTEVTPQEEDRTAEEIAQARYEAEQAALEALRTQRADTYDIDGTNVKVGTVTMFVDRGYHITQLQTDVLNELTSTSTDLVLGATAGSNETLWDRLKLLAQNFVDGVLTIAGLRTKEICLTDNTGETCIDRSQLNALIENATAPQTSEQNTAVPAADEEDSDNETAEPEPVTSDTSEKIDVPEEVGDVDTTEPDTTDTSGSEEETVAEEVTDTETTQEEGEETVEEAPEQGGGDIASEEEVIEDVTPESVEEEVVAEPEPEVEEVSEPEPEPESEPEPEPEPEVVEVVEEGASDTTAS